MPTKAELDELCKKCIWQWYGSDNTEFNGVAGYKVTSKIEGYTDRFIFLPAAGYRDGSKLLMVGNNGEYWSCSLANSSFYACYLAFYNGQHSLSEISRDRGHSVRPVCP